MKQKQKTSFHHFCCCCAPNPKLKGELADPGVVVGVVEPAAGAANAKGDAAAGVAAAGASVLFPTPKLNLYAGAGGAPAGVVVEAPVAALGVPAGVVVAPNPLPPPNAEEAATGVVGFPNTEVDPGAPPNALEGAAGPPNGLAVVLVVVGVLDCPPKNAPPPLEVPNGLEEGAAPKGEALAFVFALLFAPNAPAPPALAPNPPNGEEEP